MKIKNLKKIGALAVLSVAVMIQSFVAYAADFPSLQAYGVDTIAGYSTLLRTSRTFPNRDVIFAVTKPGGAVVNVPAVTDNQGVGKADLYDYHTRRAGKYTVSAKFKEDVADGTASAFNVYSDQVSLEQSSVSAIKTLATADGQDNVYLTVSIRDQYGNPFPGHLVNLISSRSVDNVSSPNSNPVTDINGSVTFSVTSGQPGVSVFSAVDSTAGAVLSGRAQVAFINGSNSLKDAGGDLSMLIPVAEAADAGPLHHFKISDIPAGVQPNQNVNIGVTAQDANNLTVENYTGTIHFSVEGGGDNVNLPEDYAFKAENLGTHLFSLGLSFATAGTYKIVVTDTANTTITGNTTVTVGSGGNNTQQQGGLKPVITTPAAGSYSENTQTVTGVGPAGSSIKIYDNDQEIGTVQASGSGSFTYQTNPLSDGDHKIYVVSLDSSNNVQGTSDTVQITIDTKPPTVDEITLDPTTGITPGKVISVTVMSEENLSDAALVFNQDIVPLVAVPGQPGTYTAQITAPANPGAYPIDVVLVDQLNNQGKYQAKATVNVSAEGGTVETPTQQTTETQLTEETQVTESQQTQVEAPNLPPTQVFGVIAYGSDKRVTLVWEAANDDKLVAHYRVYFGLDPVNLDKVVDTKSAATTWYVPNLENGKEYYFAVTAIDNEGTESVNRSDVVSGIPFALEVNTAITTKPTGTLAANGLHNAAMETCVGCTAPEMSKNGPEVLWLFAGTGLLSGLIRKLRKKARKG